MKFDFSWFTTIPGILITSGVVLLIIALVVFIVSSKKNKKEDKKGEVKEETPVASTNPVDQAATPIEIDSTPLQDISSVNEAAAVPIEVPVTVPEATPIPVETPAVVPDAIPTPIPVETPTVEPMPVVAPEPVVVPETIPTTVPVETPVVEPTPVVPTVTPSVVEEKPAIYGGVSEIIPNIDLNQKNEHQIYGGADPLENTQTLKVTQQPVVENEPQVSIPTVTEVTTPESQPVVNVIPTVEEAMQTTTSQNEVDSLMP